MTAVALLAEGVDRNFGAVGMTWEAHAVALLAEGVDRNCERLQHLKVTGCRPPRRGHG